MSGHELNEEQTLEPSSRLVLIVLFLVITLNLFDRQLINILAQDIKVDMALTDTELGLLTGTAFGLFKAIFAIPVGAWADRGNKSRILGGMVALCSIFSMLCGVAASFPSLVVARMGVGLSESAAVPVATSIARELVPRRATSAIALAMAGNPFGTFLAFLIGGAIAQSWGWRWAFIVAGPPGMVLAWVLISKLRDPRPTDGLAPEELTWTGGVLHLIRKPTLRPLMFATAGSMLLVSAANAWIPAFFIRAHGLGTAQTGLFAAVAVGIGGSLGTLSGMMCDVARPKIRRPESAIMIATILGSLPFMLLTVLSDSVAAALGSYFIYNVFAFAWAAPTIRLIQDAVEPRQRALAIAVCSAAGILASLGVGVPLIGWISDLISRDFGARSVGVALSSVLLGAILIALISHLRVIQLLRNSERRTPADSARSLSSTDKPIAS